MVTESPYVTDDYRQAYSVRVEITRPEGEPVRDELRLTLDQWQEIWASGIPQGDTRSFWSEAGAQKVADMALPFYEANEDYAGAQVRLYPHRGAAQ